MNTKICDLNNYIKINTTTYKLKGNYPLDRYTDDNGYPIWINKRCNGKWGYIDEKGQEWIVLPQNIIC